MVCRLLTEPIKNPLGKFKLRSIGTIPHDKIFIRIILMKLDKFYSGIVCFLHYGIGQFSGSKGFSDSRCPLKNNIFLVPEQSSQNVEPLFSHKYCTQKIPFCISRNRSGRRLYRIFLANEIHNKIKFTFCQFKQTPVWLDKKLRFLKLRTFFQYSVFDWN